MFKRIILIFVSLIVTILILEFGVRLLLPQSDRFYFNDPSSLTLRPNVRGMWYGQHPFQREFAVPIQTNRYGFRDDDHPIEKAQGVKRIAVVGDSFVEAFQVPFESTFSKQLEKLLQSSGENVEVLSFGKSGLGVREKILLAEKSLVFSPDVIFLVLNATDLNDAINSAPPPQHPTIIDGFLEYSHVARLLFRSLRDPFSTRAIKLPPLTIPDAKKREAFFEEWKRGFARFKEANPDLQTFLLIDTLSVVRSVCPQDETEEEWSAFVKAVEKDAIILGSEMCTIHTERDPLYYPFDRHWTSRAHALAAEAVFPLIRDRLEKDT